MKYFVQLPYGAKAILMGLYHPLDGITNPKYKLLRFLTTIFLQREKVTSF